MKQVVIENPIINSPYAEPNPHFKFTDEGITNEIVDGRRISSYFVPIARPKKTKGSQKRYSRRNGRRIALKKTKQSTISAGALLCGVKVDTSE